MVFRLFSQNYSKELLQIAYVNRKSCILSNAKDRRFKKFSFYLIARIDGVKTCKNWVLRQFLSLKYLYDMVQNQRTIVVTESWKNSWGLILWPIFLIFFSLGQKKAEFSENPHLTWVIFIRKCPKFWNDAEKWPKFQLFEVEFFSLHVLNW